MLPYDRRPLSTPPQHRVCILGLGRVGYPLAISMADAGLDVLGVDIDLEHIHALRTGSCFSREPQLLERAQHLLEQDRIELSDKPAEETSLLIVAVPFESYTQLEALLDAHLPYMADDGVIIIESTCGLGWTRRAQQHLASRRADQSLCALVYMPERLMPGKALEELATLDRVFASTSSRALEIAERVYSHITTGSLAAVSYEEAELIKLTENAQRALNIAFVNEIANLSTRHGARYQTVLEQARKHPRVTLPEPGLGAWGGCLPFALDQLAEHGLLTMRAASKSNDLQPSLCAEMVIDALREIDNPSVLILGRSYKANIADDNNAPGELIAAIIRDRSPHVQLTLFDPYFSASQQREPAKPLFEGHHVCVIATKHDEFTRIERSSLMCMEPPRIVFDFFDTIAFESDHCIQIIERSSMLELI